MIGDRQTDRAEEIWKRYGEKVALIFLGSRCRQFKNLKNSRLIDWSSTSKYTLFTFSYWNFYGWFQRTLPRFRTSRLRNLWRQGTVITRHRCRTMSCNTQNRLIDWLTELKTGIFYFFPFSFFCQRLVRTYLNQVVNGTFGVGHGWNWCSRRWVQSRGRRSLKKWKYWYVNSFGWLIDWLIERYF